MAENRTYRFDPTRALQADLAQVYVAAAAAGAKLELAPFQTSIIFSGMPNIKIGEGPNDFIAGRDAVSRFLLAESKSADGRAPLKGDDPVCVEWLHWRTRTLDPVIAFLTQDSRRPVGVLRQSVLQRNRWQSQLPAMTNRFAAALDRVSSRLSESGNDFLVGGEVSLADVGVACALDFIAKELADETLAQHTACQWAQRVRAQPGPVASGLASAASAAGAASSTDSSAGASKRAAPSQPAGMSVSYQGLIAERMTAAIREIFPTVLDLCDVSDANLELTSGGENYEVGDVLAWGASELKVTAVGAGKAITGVTVQKAGQDGKKVASAATLKKRAKKTSDGNESAAGTGAQFRIRAGVAPGGLSRAEVAANTRSDTTAQYQCGSALRLFATIKKHGSDQEKAKAKHPAGTAAVLVDHLNSGPDAANLNFEATNRGFINIRLSPEMVAKMVTGVVDTPPSYRPAKRRRVVVDFSSPNIAKEMHVGHLRSTIIGETLCRLLEHCGHEVLRVNHVGDWGTQFGMLLCHLDDEFPDFVDNLPNISDLNGFYKAAKARFDADAAFKERSQLEVVNLQGGNEKARRGWQALYDVSKQMFDGVYERLDVTSEICGESFYNSRIPPTIEELQSKGLLEQEENGALVSWVKEAINYPLMIRKGDGGYGYDSTDAAAIHYRTHELQAEWIVYVTDLGQQDHFRGIFSLANRAGWLGSSATSNAIDLRNALAAPDVARNTASADESKAAGSATGSNTQLRIDHVGFGVVQGKDRKRFKTRSGETVRLVDLLDEAKRRVEVGLRERFQSGDTYIPEDLIADTAGAIGYGAVKYFDLRSGRKGDYVFDYDDMLNMQGNTAVYLLYAHARICSIIRKSGKDPRQLVRSDPSLQVACTEPQELALLDKIMRLNDVVRDVTHDLMPHHLCKYLYELSKHITDFVRDCRVLGTPKENSRLLLCEAAAVCMRTVLSLLSIEAPMRL